MTYINGELSTNKVGCLEATNKDDIVLFIDSGKIPLSTEVSFCTIFEGDTIKQSAGPLVILNQLKTGSYTIDFQLNNPNWQVAKQLSVPIKVHRSFENSWCNFYFN